MTDINKEKQLSTQEWSYHFSSEEVGTRPVCIDISVPEESIPALCNRLNLYSLEKLEAKLVLSRNPVSKIIHVKGNLEADLYQYCIITMEPVHECVQDEFEAWFSELTNAVSFAKAKRERMNHDEKSEQPMLEEYDDPEEIIDGKIDLGELVTQHFSLALNPYPRQEGAVYDNQQDNAPKGEEDELYNNPFAALKEWKNDESKKS